MNFDNRLVLTEDAVSWLEKDQTLVSASMVASLPDISEFPQFSLDEWKSWFLETAGKILGQCPDDGVVIFYQTDIKHQGTWVDKSYLCQKAAEICGHHLLWHKIFCRAPAGTTTFGRPAYSHVVCFSKTIKADPGKSTADVVPDMGEKTWERGMGLHACLMIAKFIAGETSSKTVINPFCGHGSMLAAANAFGLNSIGIERSPKRAEKARILSLNKELTEWINLD